MLVGRKSHQLNKDSLYDERDKANNHDVTGRSSLYHA